MKNEIDENEPEDEGHMHNNKKEVDLEIKRILHYNDLLLFCLEEAEKNERRLRTEIAIIWNTMDKNDEEFRIKIQKYKEKLSKVEKALEVKTKQLTEHLRRDCFVR